MRRGNYSGKVRTALFPSNPATCNLPVRWRLNEEWQQLLSQKLNRALCSQSQDLHKSNEHCAWCVNAHLTENNLQRSHAKLSATGFEFLIPWQGVISEEKVKVWRTCCLLSRCCFFLFLQSRGRTLFNPPLTTAERTQWIIAEATTKSEKT